MLIVPSGPAAQILKYVRRAGITRREELLSGTGLSAATVSRTLTALIDKGLLQERPDIGKAGAVGRPRVPVQLDSQRYAVAGVHLGRVSTTVALADLRGRPLVQSEHRTHDSPELAIASVVDEIAALREQMSPRTVLAAGVVGPWTDLGFRRDATGERLGEVLGIPVATGNHMSAAAAAEHSAGRQGADGTTIYLYARDTIGFAAIEEQGEYTSHSRPSLLTHFPTASPFRCRCRAVGCLEATASDEVLGLRAHDAGVIARADIVELVSAARDGSRRADQLLRERARVLGQAAAFVRDMVQPDHLVLIGQGFTRYAEAFEQVREAFEAASTLPVTTVELGTYGADLQAAAASAVALAPVYEDPLARV